MEQKQYNLLEILEKTDPALLDYQDWLNVGMALEYEGYSVRIWDEWSRRDASRYHAGECERKWAGFGGRSQSPVTGGTIVQLARIQGCVSGWGAGLG